MRTKYDTYRMLSRQASAIVHPFGGWREGERSGRNQDIHRMQLSSLGLQLFVAQLNDS